MKIFNAVSFAVCITTLTFTGQAHAGEVCQLFESDPDGDGWGWEGGASCRISAEITGVTPQMNHPRTGESLNIERIFWLYDDFSGKTISECQGYIVDPNQARDICSTCIVPAASITHNADGGGLYTVVVNDSNAKVAGSLAITNRDDAIVITTEDSNDTTPEVVESDNDADNPADDTDTNEVNTAAECEVETTTDSTAEEAVECAQDDAVETDAAGGNESAENPFESTDDGTANNNASNSSSTTDTATDAGAGAGADAGTTDNPMSVSTVGDTDMTSGDSAEEGASTDAAGTTDDTSGESTDGSTEADEENTTDASADADADGNTDAANDSNNNGNPALGTDTENPDAGDSTEGALESGRVSFVANFDWNVDNNGIYSGALVMDFYGERTATGVRFWEVSAAGETGFYTLCEVTPSGMAQAMPTQFNSAITNNQDATACLDIDGDGWGWDGSASCLP